ncbi:MAG: HEAT repeat domain-containing protein [Candidatus Ozemobacteraceae bacterium]
MDAKTELPASIPRVLELDAWLLFGLQAGDETTRRLSLEELAASGIGSSPEILARVQAIAASDPSTACNQLANRILAAEEARLEAVSLAGQIEFSPGTFKALMENAAPDLRTALLKAVRKSPAEELLDLWRQQLLGETDPIVLEAGFSLLARFGRESDAVFSLGALQHDSTGVVTAAIDLLHAQNLGMFKEQVGSVLSSPNATIRLHGVRKLRTIDPHEASLFLKDFLSSADPLIRQRGLRELLLFPFSEAETLYFRYISAEIAPLLLVIAGLSVAFNPHPDLPVKVYDIFLVSRGLKKHILQLIVNQVVETVKEAGILSETEADYLASLKNKLSDRRTALMLRLTMRELGHSELEVRRTAFERLSPFAKQPQVREALLRHFEKETDPELKSHIGEITGETATATLPAFLEAVQTSSFFDLTPRAQRGLLATVKDSDTFRQARASFRILLIGSPAKSILLEIIHITGTYGDTGDSASLLPLLQHPENAVVAAAIRSCGQIDLDVILPQINPLLQHADPRIKTAALEVFLKADKEGAVHYLQSMCNTPQAPIRRNALSLMPLLDYSSAEPLLLAMFQIEKQADIKEQIGMMIAANPTEEGMMALYRISRDDKGNVNPAFRELLEVAVQTAVGILAPDRAAIEAKFSEAAQKEKIREQAPKPDYSYKMVVPQAPAAATHEEISDRQQTTMEQFFSQMRQNFENNKSFILVACLILSPLLYVFIYRVGGSEGISAKPGASTASSFLKTAGMDEGSKTLPSAIIGRPGNVSEFLSGPGYASVIRSADAEAEKIREEFKIANAKGFRDTLLEMSQDQNYKGCAEFYLNDNCKNGMELVENGKLEEGKEFLLKALNDPNVSEEAKMIVCETLFGVGFETGDQGAILKAYEKVFATIPANEVPPGYNMNMMREQFSQLHRIKEIKPQEFQQIIDKLGNAAPGFTPEMRQKYIDGFRTMQERFGH